LVSTKNIQTSLRRNTRLLERLQPTLACILKDDLALDAPKAVDGQAKARYRRSSTA